MVTLVPMPKFGMYSLFKCSNSCGHHKLSLSSALIRCLAEIFILFAFLACHFSRYSFAERMPIVVPFFSLASKICDSLIINPISQCEFYEWR